MESNIDIFISIFEFVGTVAFASSGAITAIERKLDLLGVVVLSVIAAVGGGVIRDIIIGKTPPSTFIDPFSAITAAITGFIIFLIMFIIANKNRKPLLPSLYDNIMQLLDTIGLGVFTVMGVNEGICCGYADNIFLLVFLGTVTGVGGGVMRDLMVKRMPYIFVKHIYASASVIGAFTFAVLFNKIGFAFSAAAGFSVIILVRFISASMKLNLPRV